MVGTGRPDVGTGRARKARQSGLDKGPARRVAGIAICRLAWLRPCGARTLIDVIDSNPYWTHDRSRAYAYTCVAAAPMAREPAGVGRAIA